MTEGLRVRVSSSENLKCFDMPLSSVVCFHERVAMTVKQI